MRDRHIIFCVACAIGLIATARAQVDQQSWAQQVNLSLNGDLGLQQEFTPTLDTLDSVQLWIPGGILNPFGNAGGSAAVNIRRGGAGGAVFASSNPVYVPAYYSGPLGFWFPDPVQLVPGELYALEPIHLTGVNGGFYGITAGYQGGRLFFDGGFASGADLMFREGIGLAPEPSTLTLLALTGIFFVGRCAVTTATNYRKTRTEPTWL